MSNIEIPLETNPPFIGGRYVSARDLKLFNSINTELMNEIIENFVQIFKVATDQTLTNIYGESAQNGKVFFPGVNISSIIEHPDTTNNDEGFGPDRIKNTRFRLHELMCKEATIYPEVGDIISWDDQYFEINNVTQEQHLGGQFTKSHSIIVDTHTTKLGRLNVQERPRQ
jgi:hypothetical protein